MDYDGGGFDFEWSLDGKLGKSWSLEWERYQYKA